MLKRNHITNMVVYLHISQTKLSDQWDSTFILQQNYITNKILYNDMKLAKVL